MGLLTPVEGIDGAHLGGYYEQVDRRPINDDTCWQGIPSSRQGSVEHHGWKLRYLRKASILVGQGHHVIL